MLRAALYARVSTEEQVEGYSIQAQQRAFRELCEQRSWSVAGEYVEEGRSARTEDVRKRPVFQQMLADARARTFDLVVVHKVDRFSRSRNVAFASFDELGKAGIGFVSIQENMDFSAPWGQFALTMLVALAQLYSDNLSQETKKGKRERKLQGYYNGLLPFGTVKDEKTRLPIPDRQPLDNGSTNYDGLLLAFREAATGKSDAEIAGILNAAGYRTTGNRGHNLWRKDSVRRMLTNRFYLGELPGKVKAKHGPLIDGALFAAVQAARAENTNLQRSQSAAKSRRTYSLTGLLRCWYCEQGDDRRRGPMRISFDGEARARCAARIEGLGCEQRSVPLALIEEQIIAWLGQITVPEDAVERALAALAEQQKEEPRPDQERRRLETRLERIKEMYGWGDMERAAYLAERDQIVARLRSFQPIQRQRRDLEKTATMLRSALLTWQAADQAQRNQLAVKLIAQVVIKDNQAVAIVPRPDVAMWAPEWQPSPSSGGSDGGRCPARRRYLRPHNLLPPEILSVIAATARATSIIEAARRHGVARQTVRRALRLFS